MKKTAIIYSFNSKHTARIAEKIVNAFNGENIEKVNIEDITESQFLSFDHIIAGTSTWFDGELPNYWDELVPAIEDMDLKGKKIAVFGLGDQKNYGENFADAVGILAKLFNKQGAEVIGSTKIEGYVYEGSVAESNGQFLGLVLDMVNQSRQINKRVENWVKQIKKELKSK